MKIFPPPDHRPRPPPAKGLVQSPRAAALLPSAYCGNSRPTTKCHMRPHGDGYHACPRVHPPGSNRATQNPSRGVFRGILYPEDSDYAHTTPAGDLTEIISGPADQYVELAMYCLSQWITRPGATASKAPWMWTIPTTHTQIEARADTAKHPTAKLLKPLTCTLRTGIRTPHLVEPYSTPSSSGSTALPTYSNHMVHFRFSRVLNRELPLRCAPTTCFHPGNPWDPEYCATCMIFSTLSCMPSSRPRLNHTPRKLFLGQ